MGGIGPKRVLLNDDGLATPPPYQYINNEFTWLSKSDLVFIDPPYDMIIGAADPMFSKLSLALKDKKDAIVVFEMPGSYELNPPGWEEIKRLGQGVRQPTAVFFRKKS